MGKKKSKTKTTTTPWAPIQPYILDAAKTSNDIVQQNQPQLNALAGDVRGHLPQLAQMAFGQQPGLQAAQGYANDVLGGKYLNSNPYMDSIVHQGEQDAGNAVNSAFSLAGRTGGGANQQALARGVAQAGNALRFSNYSQERGNQQQAASMIPGLTQAQYAGITPYLMGAQTAGSLPYAGVGALSGLLGMGAGAGQTSGTQPGGWGGALLSAAASAAPFLSDRRLKSDISVVRIAKDGMPISRWRYSFDPTHTFYEGPIADDVLKYRPEAYVPNFRGEYAGVDYALLGDLS